MSDKERGGREVGTGRECTLQRCCAAAVHCTASVKFYANGACKSLFLVSLSIA